MKKKREIFIKLFARKFFQPFFKKVHWISLRGMNYGGGFSPKNSGEHYFLNYVKKNTSNKCVIFDIGANVGQYSLLANEIFNSKCLIYAFEPTKLAYTDLVKNTLNSSNIKAFNIGLGHSIKKERIYYSKQGSVLSSIVDKKETDSFETIDLITLDHFCLKNSINKINVLKLDVEGYEYNVLNGAIQIINDIDYIQFEFGNRQIANRNYLIDFIKLLNNFNIFRLVQDGLVKIDNNPINEIFQTSNYIAINKNIESI